MRRRRIQMGAPMLVAMGITVAMMGCKGIKLPPCLTDGTLCIPSPAPSTSPSAVPSGITSPIPSLSPTPSASPLPTPVPSAVPSTSPSPASCPKPDGIKLGFFASVKKERGYRNVFNLSPTVGGKPEDESCGAYLVATYGEFQRFVTSNRWTGRDPVELQSDNPYFMVDATNSDDTNWSPDGKTYLLAGMRTYCVSYAHLSTYRCQDGTMSTAGQLVGFGTNDRGYDLAK